jgi:hypothetical protein
VNAEIGQRSKPPGRVSAQNKTPNINVSCLDAVIRAPGSQAPGALRPADLLEREKVKHRRPAFLQIEHLELRRLLSVEPLPGIAISTLREFDPPGSIVQPYGFSSPVGKTPAQIRHAYGLDLITFASGTISGDGSGQTIAIVDAYDNPKFVSSTSPSYSSSDLHKFSTQFSLPDPPSFLKVDQNGGTNYPIGNTGWGSEIALDVEWVHAIAPGANIILVEANSASLTDMFAAVDWARNQPGVSAISMSWGTSEFSGETGFDSTFATPAGHNGVTFVGSTGDSGAPGGYPAYSQNVLAVGGTGLSLSGGNYFNEYGWAGSGGGISTQVAKPSYQAGVTQSATQRTIPDVSFIADPNTGVTVYDSYANGNLSPWDQYGGTSLSAPCWAALVGIINQGRTVNSQPVYNGLGLATALYGLPSSNFNDITTGNNGFAAGPGYDLVTGLGTPKSNLLVASLIGAPLPPAAPQNLDLTTDSGISGSDNVTNINAPTISGNATAGSTVNIYADASLVGTGTANGAGAFSIVTSVLADGTYGITATATNAQGTSPLSGSFNISIDTVAPGTLNAPDLVAANDSGQSITDNITNVTTPNFFGSAEDGSQVKVYANGLQVASGFATGGNYNVHVVAVLSNGDKLMTATATDVAGNVSVLSSALNVTIDSIAPTLSASVFDFLTSQQLQFTFSENVGWSVSHSSVQVVNMDTSTIVDASNIAHSYAAGTNVSTFTFPGFPAGALPDANYEALLSGVRDVAGNYIASDPDVPFFTLAGDTNRDKTVDTTDFNTLAANFGASPRDLGQGDFNYDGTVDTTDFNLLAANFSKSLPASPAHALAAAPASQQSLFSQSIIDKDTAASLI